MDNQLPIRHTPLSEQVYNIILGEIRNGTFSPGSKLPSENELAERFNVSRPTIRTAFNRLEERGYVRKKRGIGTFVALSPSITNPLFTTFDIRERIRERGYEPGFKQLSVETIKAENKITKKLDIPPSSTVLRTREIFTADGKPIIYLINHIPKWVISDCLSGDEIKEHVITQPFHKYFKENCHVEIEYFASILQPFKAKDCNLPGEFSIKDPHAPILVIDDTGYDSNNTPLVITKEYLLDGINDYHIILPLENI